MTLTVNVKVQRAACRASEEGTSLAKATQISGAPVLTDCPSPPPHPPSPTPPPSHLLLALPHVPLDHISDRRHSLPRAALLCLLDATPRPSRSSSPRTNPRAHPPSTNPTLELTNLQHTCICTTSVLSARHLSLRERLKPRRHIPQPHPSTAWRFCVVANKSFILPDRIGRFRRAIPWGAGLARACEKIDHNPSLNLRLRVRAPTKHSASCSTPPPRTRHHAQDARHRLGWPCNPSHPRAMIPLPPSPSASTHEDGATATSTPTSSTPDILNPLDSRMPPLDPSASMIDLSPPAAAAATAIPATPSTHSSPMKQLHAIKTHTISPQEQRENRFSSRPYAYSSSSTVASAVPERTYHERSPSPHPRAAAMPHSMADAIGSNSKSPGGLIRRLSRGAHQKLRRRASQQQSLRLRDQSAGPVLVRRRSDSNAASDRAPDVSDLELEPSENGTQDDSPHPPTARDIQNGLGINLSRPSNASSYFEGGIAPAISAILQTGTLVTKHTSKHKKNKRIRLWLDPNSARVCWSLTNSGKSFFIDDVREVRVGAESRNARDDVQIADEDEGRWMTVVYEPPERSKGRTIKTMHLVFDSVVIVGYWTDALGSVARERTEIMNALSTRTEKSERSMAMVWRRAMGRKSSDDDHSFTLDDARWFCRKLEINCSDSAVRTHFTLADTGYTGKLDYTRYQIFVRSFMERKDIQNLYRNINFGTDLDLGLEAFLDFLRDDQGVDVEKERSHWEGVFEKFAKPSQNRAALPTAEPVGRQLALNQQSFRSFLTSAYNSPLLPSKGEGTLDRPLNEYFISSSHNTYLLGRQVYGASSVEGYISALIKGCRCIEIDCWDGENGRPMVTHGRTMTTKVPFEDCVSTIAKYAFHSSPYPLIVSLEVHCNAEQQKTMVDHMLKYWKTMLVTEALSANTQILPTPEELKSRILLKVKAAGAEEPEPFQFPLDGSNGRSRARSLGSTIVRTPSIDKRAFTYSPLVISPVTTSPSDTTVGTMSTPRGSITSGPTVSPSSSAEDSDTSQTPLEKTRKRKSSKIIPELGRLGVYAQGIKFPGFNEPGAKSFNHIFSFNENTFGRLCTKQTETKGLLEKHNVHYLMRVYPKAGRIDSSNFNPLEAWRRGVQMAALNWQTYDVHQQVNEAMFAAGSDRVGYVLKPEELRHSKHIPILDAGEKKEKKDKKFVKFTVDIISAQRLPRPLRQITESGMNPYIEFEMYCADDKAPGGARGEGGTDASAPNGYSGIGSPLRKRTKVIEGNGFDPIWNQPLTVSLVTKHTSLIFVRWTVWSSPEARPTSSNNVLLATFTAKLDSLQQGYRHLPLFNPQGEQYRDAKLFVKIRKENAFPIQVDNNLNLTNLNLNNVNNTHPAMTNGFKSGPSSEHSASPRIEAARPERNWRSRVFSRNPSQRRLAEQQSSSLSEDPNAPGFSRTSSIDRESTR